MCMVFQRIRYYPYPVLMKKCIFLHCLFKEKIFKEYILQLCNRVEMTRKVRNNSGKKKT